LCWPQIDTNIPTKAGKNSTGDASGKPASGTPPDVRTVKMVANGSYDHIENTTA